METGRGAHPSPSAHPRAPARQKSYGYSRAHHAKSMLAPSSCRNRRCKTVKKAPKRRRGGGAEQGGGRVGGARWQVDGKWLLLIPAWAP